jgi:membrane-bound metal-dependent hydrolase YbcI (DUF457 family)
MQRDVRSRLTWLLPLPLAAIPLLAYIESLPGALLLIVAFPGILMSLLLGESAIIPVSCIVWYALGVGFITLGFHAMHSRQNRYVFVSGLFVLVVVVPLILFTAWQLFNEHFPKYPP